MNFDKEIKRRGTNCIKWDEFGNADTIPMWVADMDFETAPCIMQALKKRMEHGCFGYTLVPETYYESNIWWFQYRHNWKINRNHFIYTSGVVPAVSAIIKAMTTAGDKVLIQTPVYNCFFSSIKNNNCQITENKLIYNEVKSANGAIEHFYTIDWDNFEQQCSDPKVKIFLLCNPHNPTGRVWTKAELTRMGEICIKHNVFIISDEIHCEFVMPTIRSKKAAEIIGKNEIKYTPFASISDTFANNCAVCISPSKAFNIAGLQIANIVVKDENIRTKIDRAININEVCDVNPFGVIALQAAYTAEGEQWLKELNNYIYNNYLVTKQMFETELPECSVTTLEGTYLLWLNIKSTGKTAKEVADYIFKTKNIFITHGTLYGETAGEGFLRINIATRRSLMEEGINKIINGLRELLR